MRHKRQRPYNECINAGVELACRLVCRLHRAPWGVVTPTVRVFCSPISVDVFHRYVTAEKSTG